MQLEKKGSSYKMLFFKKKRVIHKIKIIKALSEICCKLQIFLESLVFGSRISYGTIQIWSFIKIPTT